MDPLTIFSYVPAMGIVISLIALAVVVAIVIKRKQQNQGQEVGHLSDKRIFPILITMIVLVVGLGVSLVLVRNQQETRSKAWQNCDNTCLNQCRRDGDGNCEQSCCEADSQPPSNNNDNSGDDQVPQTYTPPPPCVSNVGQGCACNNGDSGTVSCRGECEGCSPPAPPPAPTSYCSDANNSGCAAQNKTCIPDTWGGYCGGTGSAEGSGSNSGVSGTPEIKNLGNHIAINCLAVSCNSSGCTAKSTCTVPVTVCGGTFNCEGDKDTYCGPTWGEIANGGSGCKTVGAGETKTFGSPVNVKCGSWQTDITVQGYSGNLGLAADHGYICDQSGSGGPPPSGPGPTPTPTPPPSGPVCNQACTGTGQGNCPAGMQCLSGVCRNPSCAANADCQCGVPIVDAACNQVTADKTLSTLQPGDTVTFTGYGWVDKTIDSIDLINFIISKDGVEVSNTNVTAVRAAEKDVAGYYYYKANKAYTISGIGSYSVKIRVHWVGGNVWKD